MKVPLIPLVFILYLLSFHELHAQPGKGTDPMIPLQTNRSVLFGNDIVIHDQPDQDQRNVAICSAFNGWLYAAYYYDDAGIAAVRIMRSTDNGVNWTMLVDPHMDIYHIIFTKLDIIATGNDDSNIKVFLGSVWRDTILNVSGAYVTRFNGVTGGPFEDEILHETTPQIYDLALAYDFTYPATNSNPFSIAVLYSKYYYYSDSLIFCSSSNGGISFDNHRVVHITNAKFHKVALAYGVSPTWSSGRYFAAWEEQENTTSNLGHIYTAHTSPDFNSPFTAPLNLDSLDGSTINLCRNPAIACQYNNVDNDSANLTEVVLFEKYLPSTQKFTIAGLYNKKATVSDNFQPFTIDASANNKLQPDICFNPFDSTFIVTYFDSTAQKLPYCIQNFNMMYPDTWNVLSNAYNDDNNLIAPHPHVVMDYWTHTGANAWIGSRSGGNGMAMFDAPFIYYTGDQEKNSDKNKLKVKVFPNPASEFAILEFELPRTENVKITILSTVGQSLSEINYPHCIPGKHQVKVDLSTYNPGIYILNIQAGESFSSGKISVIR